MLKLFKKMRGRELGMIGVCIMLIIGQIYFELKLPDYMSNLTVLIQTPGSTMSEILSTGGDMLLCTLASAALSILCGFLVAQVAGGFSYVIREKVFHKVADFGQKEMHEFSVPSLINRTTNDITQIQMFLAMGLQLMVKSPVMAVWAVLKIIDKSWTLSAITAGFVGALLLIMVVVIVIVLPRVKRVQRLLDDINLVSRENLNGINVVHAFNAEDYQEEKFEKANDILKRTQLFNQRVMSLLMPCVSFVMNALTLVIYWVGAAIVNSVPATDMTARITEFGNIVVFGTYATYVLMSIMFMVMIVMMLPMAQVSAGRINEVLDAGVSIQEGSQTTAEEQGTVEFQNVSFHYPSSRENVLEHISFKANKGETIAFIGATGSGKTTLVSLAARFYDATDGKVLIDGQDVRNYSFDALYNRIGYITQKAVLFAGDIQDNVLFGESSAPQTEQNVLESLEIAQASEFVDKMKDGIYSPITQGGTNVSGGQRQRLSIARALARKPEILIFDDSFSALDYRTDAKLRKGLSEQLKDTTCLIVAQRIGTIRNADKIVVLDEGKAVGIGTHEELMKNCKVYQEIAMSQLSAEELGV
ncbi:MAG: ABC transporter ATP-binding protein [Muricoprocola sp.]